jgi:hypothetical protein
MQGRAPQGRRTGDLFESEAQTATGIVGDLVIGDLVIVE